MAITDEQLNSMSVAELDRREQQLLGVSVVEELSPAGLDIREGELLDRLKTIDATEEQVEEKPRVELLSTEGQFTRDKNVADMHLSWGLANEIPYEAIYLKYEDFRDDRKGWCGLNQESKKDNAIGFVETIKNTRASELLPFVGSLFKLERISSVFDAAYRLNQLDGTMVKDESKGRAVGVGTLAGGGVLVYGESPVEKFRENDIKIVEEWINELDERQKRGISIGGRIAEGIVELPSFMIEFLLTGPIFRAGSAVTKRAATRILGRYAEKGVGKWATRVAAAGFGSLARTAVNLPRVMEGAASQMAEGIQITDDGAIAFADADRPFTALGRSFVDLYIENLTEISGKAIGAGVSKAVSFTGGKLAKRFPQLTKFAQELANKWIANGKASGVTRTMSGFLKASASKVGYDGILEEMGEEQLGRIIRSTTGLQDFNQILPSMEDLLVEAGIFSVPGITSLAANKIFRTDLPQPEIVRDLGKVSDVEFKDALKEPLFAPEAPEPTLQQVEDDPISKNTAKVQTQAIDGVQKSATVEPTSTPDAIRRNLIRVKDAVLHWGVAGKKVAKDFDEISLRTQMNVGTTSQNIKASMKGLNSKDKVTVTQLVDGAIDRTAIPDRLLKRADTIKEQLDIMQNEAIDVGLRKGELTGKAFPQVANKKGKKFLEEAETQGVKSERVFAWAQSQVSKGRFESVDSAIAALQEYRRKRLRDTESYIEGERTIELDNDMREWSPDKILPGIIEGGWEAIEGARQWGVTNDGNFKSIRTTIEQVRSETGPDQATILEDYIKAQYGQSRASSTAKKWSKRARAVQFIGKLSLSPLTIVRNMLDRYAKGLSHGTIGTNIRATIAFPPFLNRFMAKSQKIQDEYIRRGSVMGHGQLSEGIGSGGTITSLVGKAFVASEKGNQTYIALVKQLQLEKDIRTLNEMGGENGTVGRMYNRLLTIIGKSQSATRNRVLQDITNEELVDKFIEKGEVSDDVMSEVLHRTVVDSAFPLTLASKRMWWGNRPFVQVAAQFKIWSADQLRFIYKDVLQYTIATGDGSRLARFIVATWLAGEIYNIARDFITDKDESLLSTLSDPDGRNAKDISRSIGNSLIDGGIVGMIWDLTYGITSWASGPTAGSIKNITVGGLEAMNDPATLVDATKKFLLKDVPAARQAQGLLDKIDRAFFNDDNMTENYAKWRGRSFRFQQSKKREQVGLVKETIGRTLMGFSKGIPGARTLSLELIARQVLVGDVSDAADYIKGIVRDTPPDDLKKLSQVFRQSAKNHSPIGNMSADDAGEFLSGYSEENQKEIVSLMSQWRKNYNAALKEAGQELIEEGFLEELKAKTK